ncbi:hypothetical protein K0M31_018188 [Melipona bicolor]|uniref:Uncharacterized protein n=1 Tax=Melipona bicolor TaxID=60889 RepID=A0AA40KDS0_9HYME|nr:hypothetical protein K0M31_018188 [Melipona bicolor]
MAISMNEKIQTSAIKRPVDNWISTRDLPEKDPKKTAELIVPLEAMFSVRLSSASPAARLCLVEALPCFQASEDATGKRIILFPLWSL